MHGTDLNAGGFARPSGTCPSSRATRAWVNVGAGHRTVPMNGGGDQPVSGRRRARRCAHGDCPWLRARMLSRPVPKASDRQRTLAGIRTTGRAASVIDGGGASAPILLPLLTPEGIVLDVIAPRGSANRLLLLLRRRQIGNAFAGSRSGDSFLRRGGRDIVAGGRGVGGLPRQGRVCRRRRGRCSRFAAAQRKSRDRRTVDCFPDPHHPCLGSDGGRRRDGRRGCLARSLGGRFGGRLRRRGYAGVTLGAGRARIRARAGAGFTLLGRGGMGASVISIAARSEWRRATTPDTQSAPAMPPNSREIAAMRNSRRNRGVGEKSPNSGCRPECSMRPPCERARQELSSRRTVPSP